MGRDKGLQLIGGGLIGYRAFAACGRFRNAPTSVTKAAGPE